MTDALPPRFPLQPLDRNGRDIAAGDVIRVVAVDSCAHGLPEKDQERLRRIEGQRRQIVEIDRFGFVWLSFSADPALHDADFSLFPTEVTLEGR